MRAVTVDDDRDELLGVAFESAGVVDALAELESSRSVALAIVAAAVISGATSVGAIRVVLISATAVQAVAKITNQAVTTIHRMGRRIFVDILKA